MQILNFGGENGALTPSSRSYKIKQLQQQEEKEID